MAFVLHTVWRLLTLIGLIALMVWFTSTVQSDTPVAQCGIVRVDMIVRNSSFVAIFWIFIIFAESHYFAAHQQPLKRQINMILIAISTLMIVGFVASVYIPALYVIVYGWVF